MFAKFCLKAGQGHLSLSNTRHLKVATIKGGLQMVWNIVSKHADLDILSEYLLPTVWQPLSNEQRDSLHAIHWQQNVLIIIPMCHVWMLHLCIWPYKSFNVIVSLALFCRTVQNHFFHFLVLDSSRDESTPSYWNLSLNWLFIIHSILAPARIPPMFAFHCRVI